MVDYKMDCIIDPLYIIILAAGQGTRMNSTLPKVLHPIAKKPMLAHVLETAHALAPKNILIVHPKKAYSQGIFDCVNHYALENIVWVEQVEQLGTGHAVSQALAYIPDLNARVLILYGDIPLIRVTTLKKLLMQTNPDQLGLVSAYVADPFGLGRILRDSDQKIIGIIEEKDADLEQKKHKEINAGFFLAPLVSLRKWLGAITAQNAQKEYYLTDIVEMSAADAGVVSVEPESPEEIGGVNAQSQQVAVERFYQKTLANTYLQQGVYIADPLRFDLRGNLEADRGVCIDINVVLEGSIFLGENVSIGPNCVIINCKIGRNTQILANSYLENAEILENCVVGPFARIRPGTTLAPGVKIGNFVEIKNSVIGEGTKINHLSYIGDAHIGEHVNIGSHVTTCNYDGANKHKTMISAHVHIGAGSQLIAPLHVGINATIGAGSVVKQDVAPHALTLTHCLKHRANADWKRPVKEIKKEEVE